MPLKKKLQDCLSQLRETTPLVHNITNSVVMNSTANALLAIGASPVMSDATEETSAIIGLANSLVINIGTLNNRTTMAMKSAASQAKAAQRPWVLDPVGASATRYRLDTARLLMEYKPSVLRGNGSEIQALLQAQSQVISPTESSVQQTSRGVDSLVASDSLTELAVKAARQHKLVIAITGVTDVITDGKRTVHLENGHTMMARVTGTGCTATALVGACLGVEPDPFIATVTALACMGVAGQLASANSRGPGSLQLNILDEAL